MIYIFAETQREADDYKRHNNLRGARTFGHLSSSFGLEGRRFSDTDTIYILPSFGGEFPGQGHKAKVVLDWQLWKAPTPPTVIRV